MSDQLRLTNISPFLTLWNIPICLREYTQAGNCTDTYSYSSCWSANETYDKGVSSQVQLQAVSR